MKHTLRLLGGEQGGDYQSPRARNEATGQTWHELRVQGASRPYDPRASSASNRPG